jgi:hypothetical protein
VTSNPVPLVSRLRNAKSQIFGDNVSIARLFFAILAAGTMSAVAQDGPAVAGLQEWIRSLFNRETSQ